ncbi:MAG: DDE-type integrase/transposase/recombinase [Promethearchaeia archaeon]
MVGPFGTRGKDGTRVEAFQCKEKKCPHLENHKVGKEFILTTSYQFKELVFDKLKVLYEDLLKDGAKNKTIAKKYSISESQVSALRSEIESAIDKLNGLDSLVLMSQPDTAVAIDETFLKIEGTSIYIIIATGYASRKTLGVKVSKSRSKKDIREVFDEADDNTEHHITTITSDGLNATQSMAKNLNREITHVIHPHKKPFKKAIIRHYSYENDERITTTIGVKSNFFKKRGKRQFKYMEARTDLRPKVRKKRGRPKGSKTKKKSKKTRKKKKRGRKGLYTVFDKGKTGYATIDPYRNKLKLGKGMSRPVATGLNATLKLHALMSIQNNLAENINSVLRAIIRLRGPKTIESVERRIRATLKIRNHPEILEQIRITRQVRGDFLINNLKLVDYADLLERGIIM